MNTKCAVITLAALSGTAHAQTVTYDVVALTGQRAPGLPFGVNILSIDLPPAINASGDVAFTVDLAGLGVNFNNDSAVLAYLDGAGRTLAREADQLPGAPVGKQFDRFWLPRINDAGGVTFASNLRDSGIANGQRAIHTEFTTPGGALIELARTGTFAEENPDNEFDPYLFSDLIANAPFTNSAGTVCYTSGLTNSMPDLAGGGYIHEAGTARTPLNPLFPAGVDGYDPEVGVQFGLVGFTDAGVFVAPADVVAEDDEQVFVGPEGPVRDGDRVFVRGAMVGGTPDLEIVAGTRWSDGFLNLHPADRLVVNQNGLVAFSTELAGALEDENEAMLFDAPGGGQPQLLVREGDSAIPALPPILFDGFDIGSGNRFGIGIGNDGTVVFEGTLRGTNVVEGTDTGVFTVKPGEAPSLVVRESNQLPGGSLGVAFDLCRTAVVNGRGQVAMDWRLRGIFVNENNDTGIFATDRNGVLHTVLRAGQGLDVSDDPMHPDVRTVDFMVLSGTNAIGNAGEPTPFNDAGQLAMRVVFTDGTEAVVIANIDVEPEPVSLCQADFNGDFLVDIIDFGVFGAAFGSMTGDANYNGAADFNNDGLIDIIDFGVFGGEFGNGPFECQP